MQVIDEIKARVEKLTPSEQTELLTWLIERDQTRWDEQIAHDDKSGKLDLLIAEAKAERAAGKAREL